MIFPEQKQERFQMSFKKAEPPIYKPMEEYIKEKMGLTTRTETYKTSLKFLYKTLKAQDIGGML